MNTQLDHLVIAADSLEQGVAFIKESFGVLMPFGGQHPKMATHNHLMAIGDGVFLEILAIDKLATQSTRPRWFGLDDPFIRAQLKQKPLLLGWVLNTSNIDQLLAGTRFPFGKPELVTRSKLEWVFAMPEDGRLFAGGLIPYLIQWQTQTHPAYQMADLGCRLLSLDIYHPQPHWLESILQTIGAETIPVIHELKSPESAFFSATFDTPLGIKTLKSLNVV